MNSTMSSHKKGVIGFKVIFSVSETGLEVDIKEGRND
jgi:hypothetical protein